MKKGSKAKSQSLTVLPGDQTDLSNAEKECAVMKANRVFDCRIAGAPRGISVILKRAICAPEG